MLAIGLAALSLGINGTFWALVGCVRWIAERRAPAIDGHPPAREAIAILIAARNEAPVIEATLAAAARQLPASQIHVVSDGSTDLTAELARTKGVNVLELAQSRGKAGALAAGVAHFDLCKAYEVAVIVDADTELSDDYLDSGLAFFKDHGVAAVAGMARTVWRPSGLSPLGRVLLTYRERLYILAQHMLKFGQGWAPVDVIVVAPGCASMYRTSALERLQLDAPGLVIEDFNMTFATHRQRLGRIAFHPRAAIAYTQDPTNLHDYRCQVGRWALGYWQTVLRSPWRLRKFDFALGLLSLEILVSSLLFLFAALALLGSLASNLVTLLGGNLRLVPAGTAVHLALALFVPDLLLSLAVAGFRRQPAFVIWALAFPFVRIFDAGLGLRGLVRAFTTRSSGLWVSPMRRAGRAGTGSPGFPGGVVRARRVHVLPSAGAIACVAIAIAVVGTTYGGQKGVAETTCARAAAAAAGPASAGEQRTVRHVMSYTNWFWRGLPRKREVALTFDDGPGPYTPRVLAVLRQLRAPATFFVVGQQLRYFGADLAGELAPQFVIGDHTENHLLLPALSLGDQRRQIQAQVAAVTACGAPYPLLFRPPYGGFNNATLGLLAHSGMLMVLWSVDTRDYTRPGVQAIVHNALAGARAGSIILMHDGGGPRSETVAALPAIIGGLRARHLRLVTVPQLLIDDPPDRRQPQPHSLSGPPVTDNLIAAHKG